MSFLKNLITPVFFGSGVGLLLYGSMSDLPLPAYLVNIPFWPLVVMPSGIIWKNKFLNKINEGQFPPEMKSYKQLFVFSRKAVIYELFLNQLGYHTIMGLTFMAYTYYARKFYDPITPAKPLSQVFQQSLFGFFKLRMLFTTISLVTQFWGAKINLIKDSQGNFQLNSKTKRGLLIKQTIIGLLWMTSIAQLVHEHYPLQAKSEEGDARP